MPKRFFEERTEQSEAKSRIVKKYFFAWCKVIMPTAKKISNKIAYIDLYAGPGRYKDDAASTPLEILKTAIDDPMMSKMLVSYFNDASSENSSTLQEEISKLPGIDNLTYQPIVKCGEIDGSSNKYFNEIRGIPSFSFIDPFGYLGLSLNVIKDVISDWGCDCLFFFNYNRINAGISNDFVAKHINALFSQSRADHLRRILPGLKPEHRERLILEELSNEIKRLGGRFILPFTFKNSTGSRTSHKLIFVSKNFKGYEIMKDIMAKESSTHDEGVPSFTYSPADASTPFLFSFTQPLSTLRHSLLIQFAGEEISFGEIYRRHSVGTPFVRQNYRSALIELETQGLISVYSTEGTRRVGTYPPHVRVRFPKGGTDGK